MRVAAGRRESTDHRRATWREHHRCGQLSTVAVAVEPAGDGYAFSVVGAVAVVPAESLVESVEEAPRRQPRRAEPVVRGQERSQIYREKGPHRGSAAQHVTTARTRGAPASGRLRWLGHRSAPCYAPAVFTACHDHS